MKNVFSMEEVFSHRLFRIPDYQRGYAWEEPQIQDMVEDIELLGPQNTHFTGTLVLHKTGETAKDSEMNNYAIYDVVDGQQRLTTLVILLDALRRAMRKAGMPAAGVQGIRKSYISTDGIDEQPLYKIKLNQDCDAYFRENILSETPGPAGPSIYSHQRLSDARDYFSRYLCRKREEKGDDFPDWLMELCDKITGRLVVCLYEIDDAAEVGVVFETMNDRGKRVSELEKVKNYLLYLGSKASVDNATLTERVNDSWSAVFRNLMEADLVDISREEQLLRMNWLMAYDPNPKNWDGCRSVKRRLGLRAPRDDHKRLVGDAIAYAETLKKSSIAYRDAAKPTDLGSFAGFPDPSVQEGIRNWSCKLERLNVLAPFLPLLGAVRLRFPEDPVRYLKTVKLSEFFGFRVYMLLGRRADAGQTKLFRIAYDLFHADLSFDEALQNFRDVLRDYCTHRQFMDAFAVDPEFDWYDWSGLKYFLYEYEDHLAQECNDDVEVAWHVVQQKKRADTIEHILPQNATKRCWRSAFHKKDREKWTNDLGNLTLSTRGDNSSLSNDCFSDKKGEPGQDRRYVTSSFRIARELCGYDEWTPDTLKLRRKKLVAWAESRWGADRINSLVGQDAPKQEEE